MTYKILSFDGGGIRGLVTLAMLKKLQAEVPDLLDQVDLIAGTSIGGIIALGLAYGMSLDQLTDLLAKNGAEIFDRRWLHNLVDIGQIGGAEYDNASLKQLLFTQFGTSKLYMLKKKVLIPSFNLDNQSKDPNSRTWSAQFFHNFNGEDSDGEELVTDVALRTSAAPTYFPSAGVNIDGGVIANNPSMAALSQVFDKRAIIDPRPELSDVRLLSISTGANLTYISGQDHDWGIAQWAKPLANILFEGSSDVAAYYTQAMLQEKYCRLAPVFPANLNIPLDDYARATELINFGNGVDLRSTVAWLKENWI